MGISEYDKRINRKMVNINIKEIPASKFINPPDFESMSEEDKRDLYDCYYEMAYVLVHHLVNQLDPIDRAIIRHQFELPRSYYDPKNRWKRMSRLQLSGEIGLHRKTIKKRREAALKKLFALLNSQF